VGLVDTTGTLQDAVSLAAAAADMGSGPYRTRILPRPKTFFERLNEQFAAQSTKLWQSMASTRLERELWRHSRVIERLAGSNGSVQARLPVRLRIE
jgi:protease-4